MPVAQRRYRWAPAHHARSQLAMQLCQCTLRRAATPLEDYATPVRSPFMVILDGCCCPPGTEEVCRQPVQKGLVTSTEERQVLQGDQVARTTSPACM